VRERANFDDLKGARNKPLLAEEHAFRELMRRKHFVYISLTVEEKTPCLSSPRNCCKA